MNIPHSNTIPDNQNFKMKLIKTKNAKPILKKWFPEKTYASLELDLLDFTDLNGKNIVARADKACDNALIVSARGQSFFIFPSGQRYDRKKFVRTLFKEFREKARDLTERINLNLYNDEFLNKPSGKIKKEPKVI